MKAERTLYPVNNREVHCTAAYLTAQQIVWVDGNNDGAYTYSNMCKNDNRIIIYDSHPMYT